MKLLVGTLAASLLAGDATAFVSPSPLLSRSPAPSSRTVLNESPSPEFLKEPGVVPPTGFWDPAGFCNGCDPCTFVSLRAYARDRVCEGLYARERKRGTELPLDLSSLLFSSLFMKKTAP
uniref:Uncharacterized protein n=1 Tax=Chromera velia CCMP2878 TaxID=1169474 RepID=A0A0G4GLP4_9ALVE|eukprot:Cvel_22449.t1-p1 / transcript=Cvel_22449.t1 / gene=Cvel_22449 / organism=Chromera_velia_CCMP2878 / gene_product=hypothetical protein / transcript_product=hypothetical protein / location=Cvel_scaffold2206:29368-30878(+) / protein_length=119 / sequence_SO=supercontig / SO=protein_coding / is_pseudo=false